MACNLSTKTWTRISKISNIIAGITMVVMAVLWFIFRNKKDKHTILECKHYLFNLLMKYITKAIIYRRN